jgi:hypothetical protein
MSKIKRIRRWLRRKFWKRERKRRKRTIEKSQGRRRPRLRSVLTVMVESRG